MKRKIFFMSTKNEDSWQQLLAKPDNQWETGYSAKALAYCWEKAAGFPKDILSTFKNSKINLFKNVELLFAFPEYKVALYGGNRDSQNDIYVVAKSNHKLISIMVEGKVREPFGEVTIEWEKDCSTNSGKPKRLSFLLKKLNLNYSQVQQIRYQLLHRAVSAILEAQRIEAKNALILIHSFSQTDEHFDDFAKFVKLFGLPAKVNSITGPYKIQSEGIDLYFGWSRGDKYYLTV
ncbi:MAG: hypothetical protein PHR39_08000 [Actinomycetota bacterium]|nr:hypothetical protein [Actinomycetota bacterium]